MVPSPWLRSGGGAALVTLLAALLLPAPASSQAAPALSIDEDITAFSFAPDGRLAYAVRRILTTRRLELQRDDIWVATLDGRKKRIVDGEKIIQGGRGVPYSYAVYSIRWAPDGTRLTVEMHTSQLVDARGNTEEGRLTLLLDQTGKEIKIQGADSVIPGATNARWLGDGVTVVYFTEAVKPRLLYAIESVRPVAGRGAAVFEKNTFLAAAWLPKEKAAVAVERSRDLSGPPRLVWLDLARQERKELAVLEGYVGQLALSPSGKKVAYFRDAETLEVREVASPQNVRRIRVAYGRFQWAPDERRLLIKRGPERRSGELAWVNLDEPEPAPRTILNSQIFRDFEISPDGRWLAALSAGQRPLVVFPLE